MRGYEATVPESNGTQLHNNEAAVIAAQNSALLHLANSLEELYFFRNPTLPDGELVVKTRVMLREHLQETIRRQDRFVRTMDRFVMEEAL